MNPVSVAACALVLSCDLLISAAQSPEPLPPDTEDKPVCFEVDIADTPKSRAKGLMHRGRLGESHGMLFVYERPRVVRFWMKNVAVPLDILFVDESGRVTGIVEDAVPGEVEPMPSPGPISFVLEITGGASRRAQLTEGAYVDVAMGADQNLACVKR